MIQCFHCGKPMTGLAVVMWRGRSAKKRTVYLHPPCAEIRDAHLTQKQAQAELGIYRNTTLIRGELPETRS